MNSKLVTRRLLAFLLLAAVLLVFIEVTLRKVWGFGQMVLFQQDDAFEYIAQPNQNQMRFGNRIIYNEYSMRSNSLNGDDSCIILGFGDSVINGGALTDHDSLATTIVEHQLDSGFRFLNISAGSWGLDNCAGYLKTHGDFKAKMIVLFVSSHDAHDNMTFEQTVGVHESYPDKQYPLAVIELFAKYLVPRLMSSIQNVGTLDPLMINKHGIGFNTGFDFFTDYSRDHNIPLIVCLHLEKVEVANNRFNEQGEEILEYCKSNNIKVISGLEIGEKENHFRDDIHLNEHGQKLWATALLSEIRSTLKNCH